MKKISIFLLALIIALAGFAGCAKTTPTPTPTPTPAVTLSPDIDLTPNVNDGTADDGMVDDNNVVTDQVSPSNSPAATNGTEPAKR